MSIETDIKLLKRIFPGYRPQGWQTIANLGRHTTMQQHRSMRRRRLRRLRADKRRYLARLMKGGEQQ